MVHTPTPLKNNHSAHFVWQLIARVVMGLLLAWFCLSLYCTVCYWLHPETQLTLAGQLLAQATHRMELPTDYLREVVTWINAGLASLGFDLLPEIDVLQPLADILKIWQQSAQIVWVRGWACLSLWPLLLIFMPIALIDGMTQRQIRRYCGARESTFLFHQLKRGIQPGGLSLLVVYWLLPLTLPAGWVVLPSVLLASSAIALSCRHFKKYV